MHDVDLSSVARLIGDRTRATMLTALLDGRALTAGELATVSGVTPATASGHLAKLLDGRVVAQVAQGRHRYYRLAGPAIAGALEALATVSAAAPVRTLRASAAARALKPARLCYDHIAGELGVRIHDHLVGCGAIAGDVDGLHLTAVGSRWFGEAGVDVDTIEALGASRRLALRRCLDWTERRDHLAGSVAAALADALLANGWLSRRSPGERGLRITEDGAAALDRLLGPIDQRATA